MAALVITAYFALATIAGNEAVSNAELLCMVMDNTRSIAPCIPSEASHSVTIDIKLAGGENAAEVCRQVQSSLAKQHMFFDDANWRLYITTPTSGGTAVASCDLPQTPK